MRGTRLNAILPAASTPTRVQFTIYEPNRLQRYTALAARKDAIEGEIGAKLEWRELPDKKESQVRQYLPEVDPKKMEDWPRQFALLRTTLERFHRAFGEALTRI